MFKLVVLGLSRLLLRFLGRCMLPGLNMLITYVTGAGHPIVEPVHQIVS